MKCAVGAILLGLLAIRPADAAPAQCQYTLLSGLPIQFDELKPTLAATINGKPVTLLVDTGSTRNILVQQSAEKLGLKLTPGRRRYFGVGGETKLDKTVLDDISLGSLAFHKQAVFVAEDFELHQDMLLGAEFLFQKDLEMSLRAKELKLFKSEGCDEAFLAYWDVDAQDVPLEKLAVGDPRAAVTVELNGKKLRALIDSGAQRSAINLAAASKLGITPESENIADQGTTVGIGKQETKHWTAKFQSFTIGGETINNPKIDILDLYGAAKSDSIKTGDIIFDDEGPEMLLGADFLRAHHVLFAFSQRRFYFSYLGGSVFDVSSNNDAPPLRSQAQ